MKTLLLAPLGVLIFFCAITAKAQTPAPCEEPYPQVQNLQASVESQSVELTWDPILGSLGCRVQLRQVGNTAWQTATVIQPDLDAFSISGSFLEYQTDYEARVACGCSTNPVIIGPYSEIVSFSSGTTGQQVPCENPYPEVLNPSSAPSAENDAIVLSWEPIPQSAGCQIEYSLVEGGVLNTAQVFESELSSFSIPEGDLIPNQDYQWRVRCGCSLNPLVVGPWIEFQEFNSGEIGFDCPNLDANIGDVCDDGDESTLNDSVTANCECIGINLCPDQIPEGTVCNPLTGRIWMDRNLGASRVALSPSDEEAYGDFYQWGRGSTEFTIVSSSPFDWSNPQNNNYWQGEDGINNPCPQGFRVPTDAEWEEERLTWVANNRSGAFASALKLPAAGLRNPTNGVVFFAGSHGNYWSSTVDLAGCCTLGACALNFLSNTAYQDAWSRGSGFCVRCIQD